MFIFPSKTTTVYSPLPLLLSALSAMDLSIPDPSTPVLSNPGRQEGYKKLNHDPTHHKDHCTKITEVQEELISSLSQQVVVHERQKVHYEQQIMTYEQQLLDAAAAMDRLQYQNLRLKAGFIKVAGNLVDNTSPTTSYYSSSTNFNSNNLYNRRIESLHTKQQLLPTPVSPDSNKFVINQLNSLITDFQGLGAGAPQITMSSTTSWSMAPPIQPQAFYRPPQYTFSYPLPAQPNPATLRSTTKPDYYNYNSPRPLITQLPPHPPKTWPPPPPSPPLGLPTLEPPSLPSPRTLAHSFPSRSASVTPRPLTPDEYFRIRSPPPCPQQRGFLGKLLNKSSLTGTQKVEVQESDDVVRARIRDEAEKRKKENFKAEDRIVKSGIVHECTLFPGVEVKEEKGEGEKEGDNVEVKEEAVVKMGEGGEKGKSGFERTRFMRKSEGERLEAGEGSQLDLLSALSEKSDTMETSERGMITNSSRRRWREVWRGRVKGIRSFS